MNDFAPTASGNGKLVLQKILSNEVCLFGGNQKSEIVRGKVLHPSLHWFAVKGARHQSGMAI